MQSSWYRRMRMRMQFGWVGLVGLCLVLSACNRVPVPDSPQYRGGNTSALIRLDLVHTTDRGVLPVVAVGLAGERTHWLLDTGSSHNLISPQWAQRLQLKVVSGSYVTTIGGQQSTQHVALPPLQLGSLTLNNQSASVVNLDSLPLDEAGRPLAGLLGVMALEKMVVELDYANHTLHLQGGDNPQISDTQLTAIPFELVGGVPVSQFSVLGNRPGRFILDTGNATALVLLPSYTRAGVPPTLRFVETRDLGGPIPTRLARLAQLQIADRLFTHVPVSLPLQSRRQVAVDGSLGNRVLGRQRVIFDFPRRRLLLGPTRFHDFVGSFGFLLAENNVLAVVLAGSPAQLAGLRAGDRIVAVNGVNTVKAGAARIWQLVHDQPVALFDILRGQDVQQIRLERAYFLPLLN